MTSPADSNPPGMPETDRAWVLDPETVYSITEGADYWPGRLPAVVPD